MIKFVSLNGSYTHIMDCSGGGIRTQCNGYMPTLSLDGRCRSIRSVVPFGEIDFDIRNLRKRGSSPFIHAMI